MTEPWGIVLDVGAVLACAVVFIALPGMLLVRPFVPGGRPALGPRVVLGYLCGYASFTVLADLLTRAAGTSAVTLLVGPAAGTLLIGLLFVRSRFRAALPPEFQLSLPQLAGCAALACLVIGQVVPVAVGGEIYWGQPYTDHTKHVCVTHVVARTGAPPLNPAYAPFGDQPLFYYFGYYLFPGSLVRYAGSGAITAVLTCAGLSAVCFLGLCVSLANYLVGSRRGGWLALALCLVTGLDIIPVFLLEAEGRVMHDIEWWNPGQVTAITGFLVWVPQHATAACYVLVAHVLLGGLGTSEGPSAWRDARLVPVVLLTAACAMTSTYVAEVLFGSLFLYALLPFFRPTPGARARSLSLVTLTAAALLILPFYLHLRAIDRYEGPSQLPNFRPFAWENWGANVSAFRWFDRFQPFFGGLQAYRLFTLPIQYALEFGFWAIVAVWWAVHGLRRGGDPIFSRLGVMCVWAVFLGSVFVSVRKDPDLNWRALHPVQGALVAVGAAFLLQPRPAGGRRSVVLRCAVVASLYLGVMGSLYDAHRLRFSSVEYPNPDPKIAARASAGRRIEAVTPVTARVQYNPTQNPPWLVYLNRPFPISDSAVNSRIFGVCRAEHAVVLREVASIFRSDLPAARRARLLARYKIDYLLVQKEDPIFRVPLEHLFPVAPSVVCSSEDWFLIDTSALAGSAPGGPSSASDPE